MTKATKNLNSLQNYGMLKTVKQQKVNTTKPILLNLRQKVLSQFFFYYSDAYILVIRDITVTADNDADVWFKICASFSTCKTEINDVFIDETNHIYIAMPM